MMLKILRSSIIDFRTFIDADYYLHLHFYLTELIFKIFVHTIIYLKAI